MASYFDAEQKIATPGVVIETADDTTSTVIGPVSPQNPLPVRIAQVTSGQTFPVDTTVVSGDSLFDTLDLELGRVAVIMMPAAWTAAVLTVRVSPDGSNFQDLYDQTEQEYQIHVAAGRAYLVNIVDFIGIRFIQFRSGTAAAPVVQTADRTLSLNLTF